MRASAWSTRAGRRSPVRGSPGTGPPGRASPVSGSPVGAGCAADRSSVLTLPSPAQPEQPWAEGGFGDLDAVVGIQAHRHHALTVGVAAVALAVHRGARTAEFDLDHDVEIEFRGPSTPVRSEST